MRIFIPKSIEDYQIMMEYLINLETIFMYQSDDESTFLVSENEIENSDEKIIELLDERSTEIVIDDILTQDDLDELADFFDGV